MSADRAGRTVAEEFEANWPLLLSAMMGIGLASTTPYSIAVFLRPMRHELGLSADLILLGFSFIGMVGALSAPLAGQFTKWLGARGMVLAGTVILTGGIMGFAFMPPIVPAFFAIYLFIAIGQSVVFRERFVAARGLAVSIALCGSKVPGAVSTILATS